MKLDKIRFAKLVGYIQRQFAISFSTNELNDLDEIIDVAIAEAPMMGAEQLHVLMALMQEGTSKIEAIRQYRMMTGYGLKDSKDIVEKYWRKMYDPADLRQKLKDSDLAGENYIVVEKFLNNL